MPKHTLARKEQKMPRIRIGFRTDQTHSGPILHLSWVLTEQLSESSPIWLCSLRLELVSFDKVFSSSSSLTWCSFRYRWGSTRFLIFICTFWQRATKVWTKWIKLEFNCCDSSSDLKKQLVLLTSQDRVKIYSAWLVKRHPPKSK